jgi:protein dithiol:quinone oxidoreductase
MLWGAAVVLPLVAVALALVSQHRFGMEPCPWCVLQRVVFLAISLAALPAWVVSARPLRLASAAAVVALAAGGVAAALWQHFVAAASASCNLTLADRIVGGLGLDALLPDVFEPRASCADSAVALLGLPYEFWSLGVFVLLAALAVAALRRR